MDVNVLISERIQDLRKEKGLTLEQLAEQTGLSRAALSNYENDNLKDISLYAVTVLARFYGVTTDYLLALTQQKNHPDAEILDLHLSDEMIDILKSGKINNRLLCEFVTHSEFRRLLLDIEVYVDRLAGMQIDNLNAVVATTRAEILTRENPEGKEQILRALELAYVQESDFFTHIVHEDIDGIIADIREAHKEDQTTADDQTTATKLRRAVEDAAKYEGATRRSKCVSIVICLTSLMRICRQRNLMQC